MSMRYSAVELCVPPGFQNILRLISHEVLRVKPGKTPEFVAGFLDDLLDIRKASGYDPVTQGDMIDRVQEQYWKLQRMKRESEAKSANVPYETEDNATDPCDGSGDTGEPTSIENDAEALVTIAMSEENEEKFQQETDQPIDDIIEEEMVAKQPPPAEPQEDTTISGEGGMEEVADEGYNEDSTEAVTIATKEEENE